MSRTLPTAALLTGGKIAVASVRDLPYTITFAYRQAFSQLRTALYRLSHFLTDGKIAVAASADMPYTITFAHSKPFSQP
ncbi:MAG TPA: hypothetical protein H9677_01475 [Firmicutes bacterium]|nr:hypothetical protein [Bacillota bacterium]